MTAGSGTVAGFRWATVRACGALLVVLNDTLGAASGGGVVEAGDTTLGSVVVEAKKAAAKLATCFHRAVAVAARRCRRVCRGEAGRGVARGIGSGMEIEDAARSARAANRLLRRL